ncbi:MAG: hypothetical protein AAFQ18_13145, partial [Pseudomonadota bacterium]
RASSVSADCRPSIGPALSAMLQRSSHGTGPSRHGALQMHQGHYSAGVPGAVCMAAPFALHRGQYALLKTFSEPPTVASTTCLPLASKTLRAWE